MKFLILMMAISSCAFASVQSPEKSGNLSSKIVMSEGGSFFVLSDGSFWRVFEYKKRPRTFAEWLSCVKIVPENYECAPKDWIVGSKIQVFSKKEYLEVDESNAVNRDSLKQCNYLLVNSGNGQVLFGAPLNPADCLTQVHQSALKEGLKQGDKNEYQKGYNVGIARGRSVSSMNPAESYDKGYKDGYKEGYSKGAATCHNTEDEIYKEIYDKGHLDGYECGFKQGYQAAESDEESCEMKSA